MPSVWATLEAYDAPHAATDATLVRAVAQIPAELRRWIQLWLSIEGEAPNPSIR